MNTIKKYFIQSIIENENQSIEKNRKLDAYLNIHDETQRVKNEFNNSYSKKSNVPDFATKSISQLTETVSELMSELQSIKSSASGDNEKNRNSIAEIQSLTEKLNCANKKVCNYRNQVMQLKNDLQVTQNALLNEIGDSSLMQAVLTDTGSSNSRGRAQKILVLQQEVNELQAKLNKLTNKDVQNVTVVTQHKEKTRADEAIKNAQSKVDDTTKTLEVWKNRSKALDVEITALRVQIQKLISKSENNEKLISNLKAEISNNSKKNNVQQFKTKDVILKLEDTVKLLQSKIAKNSKQIKQQESALNEKDVEIARLESKIMEQNKTITNHDLRKIDFLNPKDIFLKKLNALENQQLLELLCIAHEQICKRVKEVADLKDTLSIRKQKSHYKHFDVSKSSKQSSYHMQQELNPNEELMELKNRLELIEEQRAALKERSDTLEMTNNENLKIFAKALDDLKQQFVNKLKFKKIENIML